jgi:hypothetical protein
LIDSAKHGDGPLEYQGEEPFDSALGRATTPNWLGFRIRFEGMKELRRTRLDYAGVAGSRSID